MISEIISSSFRFLTPAFAHGVYQGRTENTPELRAPSVRGQLRWWWRTLGYGLGNDLFGAASGSTGTASRIQVRLAAPLEPQLTTADLLAHKNQGAKNAIAPQADLFTAQMRPVRGGISEDHHRQLNNSLLAWLLMGAVGQRAGRCCGSPWPDHEAPTTAGDYLKQCRTLLQGSKARIALLDPTFESELQTRQLAGRFVKHNPPRGATVPGQVFGSARPRKSSSLKLRTVYLGGAYRIAALWVPKTSYDSESNLTAALQQMKQHPGKADLAVLLETSLPDLLS